MPTSRSARKQRRLAFTPLPSSSPAAKDYHPQIRDRAAAVTLDSSPSSSKRPKVSTIPTPAASLEKPVKASKEPVSPYDSNDETYQPTQRKSHSWSKQQRLDFSSARGADSFVPPVALPSSSRQRSSKSGLFSSEGQQALVELSSDSGSELPVLEKVRNSRMPASEREYEEGEDSDVIISTATRRRQKRALQESEDEYGMPTTEGKKKRHPRRTGPNSSFIVDSPPAAIDSDDDVVIMERPRKKRRREASESEDGEDGEDDQDGDAEPVTPSRRRLKQRKVLSQQEKDDLAEDVGDLGAGSDFEFNPVTSQSSNKSARQAALDRLKRKRTGRLPQVIEEESEGVGNEDGDAEQEEDYDNYEEADEVPVTSSRQIFKPDESDDDFVVDEEEEGPLGVPDNGLPIEFTKYASMKPKELFKYAVEWMVQKKINPAFSMNDQLYDLTFKKLDDEVRGLAGSKFTSSAWKPDFILALQARPEIAFERLDRSAAEHYLRDKCDACNRSGHPATWEIQFRGQPYHRNTLEDVANDDDEGEHEESGSDSDDAENNRADRPAWDAQDREIVPETHIFYVGKFCKSNAETAHSLQHWRHALYDWVVTFLTGRGYFHGDRLVEREKWNTKKRRKYANKIVDQMERDGEVKRLWRSFRQQVDVARNSKEGRFVPDSP